MGFIGHAKESRVIQHFDLTSWPDHGVLQDFQVIAPMLEAMNSYRCEMSPALQVDARVVVYCSAGIGRSGTLIAIDILLKKLHQALLDKSKSVEERKGAIQHAVDIPPVVHRLRSQRPGMVQTPIGESGVALRPVKGSMKSSAVASRNWSNPSKSATSRPVLKLSSVSSHSRHSQLGLLRMEEGRTLAPVVALTDTAADEDFALEGEYRGDKAVIALS
ncbi:hypothetical protein PsorP6_005872 [Peronosclerospora sorghi]|uniref:Uncharacterized protein n=1 Tax=Peronosclerospora sorghi TaxID=230839 RepID=A0ACC0W2A9_9STRA|nr:hypothetical protein PsorP6_005872 [Peronosclerospora sorghi]